GARKENMNRSSTRYRLAHFSHSACFCYATGTLNRVPNHFVREIMAYMSTSYEKLIILGEIRVLIAAAFIIAIGFGIITPVLPSYAESFGVGAFGVSAVVSIFGLARLILAPLSG